MTLSRSFCWRKETIERAFVSSSTTWNVSPASGRSSKPVTSTGVAGPATATFAPRSSCIERTRPKTDPAKKTSPTERVPDWTSTVTTLPRPASRRASSTTPRASSASGAVSSCMSATIRRSSRRCSIPCFFRAEISADGHVAPPGFEQHAAVGELLLDPVGVGVGLVDLVDRDDDRDLGRAGVIDRLDRLRHHAVVRRDDQDDDVGRLGAARAHRGEGLVARRVEKDDRLAVDLDAVGADVLRDAPRFSFRHLGLADRVEKRGLPVVDVAHDGHDRRPRNARSGGRVPLLRVLPRRGRAPAPPRRRRRRPRPRPPWRAGSRSRRPGPG